MSNEDITNYPLSWPVGWVRTEANKRKRSQFGKHSILSSVRELENQVRMAGGRNIIISTNLRVRNDGIPYSNQRTPEDSGVAVYFDRKGAPKVLPCDKWKTVEENLWAIVKHIDTMRSQERWGVGSLDQAFAGYVALPDPNQRDWWDVLGVAQTASDDEIKQAYFRQAKIYHPDKGGDAVLFDQVQKAYDLAIGKGGA